MTITDPAKVLAAAEFIRRYPDNWIDLWTGAAMPTLLLVFYDDSHAIGDFGIARNYITNGALLRKVPEHEITALANKLEIQWPPANY